MVILSIQTFWDLYDSEYFANVDICFFQPWENYKLFSCIDKPRKMDLLCYFHECRGTFKMKSGDCFVANPEEIIYMPSFTEYTLTISDRQASGCTYGINFTLFDKDRERFTIGKSPVVFNIPGFKQCMDIFSTMSKVTDAGVKSTSKLKSGFYEIVTTLCEAYRYKNKERSEFRIIEKGIHYLESDYKLSLSVAEIADMCKVSENYFRRLFKEYSGVSPKEYILNAKIDKAKLRLREGNIPISEIASICGFPDTAYFCRVFKKRTGLSPLAYRNSRI